MDHQSGVVSCEAEASSARTSAPSSDHSNGAWDKYLEQPKVHSGEAQWPRAQEKWGQQHQQEVDTGCEPWPQQEKAVVVQHPQLDKVWLDEEEESRLYEKWEQNASGDMRMGQCPLVNKDWEQNKKWRQDAHVDTGSVEWPMLDKPGDQEKGLEQQSHIINGWDQDKRQRWEQQPLIHKGWEQRQQINKGWGLQSHVAKGWEEDKRWGQQLLINNKWERQPHVNKVGDHDKEGKQHAYVDNRCEQTKRWGQWPHVNKDWRQDREWKQREDASTTSRQWPHVDNGRGQGAEVGKEWGQQLHHNKRWELDNRRGQRSHFNNGWGQRSHFNNGWGQRSHFNNGWRQQSNFNNGWRHQSQFNKGWEQQPQLDKDCEQNKGGKQQAHVSNGWEQSQGWGQRTHVNKGWGLDKEWEQKEDVEVSSGRCSVVDKGWAHQIEVHKGCGQQKQENKGSGADDSWEQSTQLASPSFGWDNPKKINNDVLTPQEITYRSTEDHQASRSLSTGSKGSQVPQMRMATGNLDVTTRGINIKLMIDSKVKRVLYAEAGKEVIDFLFSFLALPVASIIKLITKKNMSGSMGNLYESAESIDSAYVLPNLDRTSLLKPALDLSIGGVPLQSPNVEPRHGKFYRCSSTYHCFVTNLHGTRCPKCNREMKTEMSYLAGRSSDVSSKDAGYVKGGLAKYLVTDELSVMPMCTISSISLLKKFNVTDVGFIEEKIVNFRTEEGLEILKAALESQTVLSEVFLWKETNAEMGNNLQPREEIKETEDTNMVSESTSIITEVADKALSIKILMDRKARRVLFAETEKELIDFLFSLLALPVASITELINKDNMVGSMGNLYESVENMSSSYMQPNVDKNFLLQPKVVLPTPNVGRQGAKYYMCSTSFHHNNVTHIEGTKCPSCRDGNYLMCTELAYVAGENSDGSATGTGYMKGGLEYWLTDELEVIPSPAISRTALLEKYNVDDVGLFEKTFDFGVKEGLQVLKAALRSKTVLTDVFGETMVSEMK